MLVKDAIAEASALTGQVVTQATALRWLSELDGQLAIEFYLATEWAPYTTDDLNDELAVPFPWDGGVYVHYLEAMTYFTNGEYERYANARAMSEEKLDEFRRHVQRMKTCCGKITVPLAGEGGSGVTVVGEGQDLWRYISAYGTAVRCGFTGTPEEWLASLVGGDGMSAGTYDPAGDVEDAGGIPDYVAAQIAGKQNITVSAPAYDATVTYALGAYCSRGGSLYRCTTDIIEAEPWTAAHWTEVTVCGELAADNTALDAKQAKIKNGTVALSATWTGEGPYSQAVTVTGATVTASSKIDLQPTAAQLAQLITDGTQALVIENNAGVLTAYAIGDAPTVAMTVQCTVTEVDV